MIQIAVQVRAGGKEPVAAGWASVADRERFILTVNRRAVTDDELYRLRTSVHRMCVHHGLLGNFCPVIEVIEESSPSGHAQACSSNGIAEPFYVADIGFPAVVMHTFGSTATGN